MVVKSMRALLAVVCLGLFYVASAAMAAGLLWVSYVLLGNLDSNATVPLFLMAGCLIGAGIILASVAPRLDRFVPPGLPLVETEHPALFTLIRDVAARANQAPPHQVYGILGATIYVTQRGGMLGIGRKRVMVVGLALLQAFDVAELRAALAHELGHFDNSESRLQAWTYQTRFGIGRSVMRLHKAAVAFAESKMLHSMMSSISFVFGGFARGYLHLSRSAGQAQEFAADRVAARVAGSAAVGSGLATFAQIAAPTDAYLQSEIDGLVRFGIAPPVLDGLRTFATLHQSTLAASDISAFKMGVNDPFDAHPSTTDRIAALQLLQVAGPTEAATANALTLVQDPETLAFNILQRAAGKPLQRTSWDQTGAMLAAQYRKDLLEFQRFYEAASVADICNDPAVLTKLWQHNTKVGKQYAGLAPAVAQKVSRQHLVTAFTVALVDAGWMPHNSPGQPMRFTRNTRELYIRPTLDGYFDGAIAAADWITFWHEAGLPARPWATLATGAGDDSSVN